MTNSTNIILIEKVLDKYFSFMGEQGDYAYGAITEQIPKAMLDKSKAPDDEGYSFWLLIDSTITDMEIAELEKLFRHKLPDSFKFFLKQNHFIDLYLGQDVRFFDVLPGKLVETFKTTINDCYWNLLDRNYLPFANYGDWGVCCFNAKKTSATHDYEIVILDHDDDYQKEQFYANSFLNMFELFDKELDETIMQIREHKKNKELNESRQS